ncbi:MAG: hypothetical protein AAGA48_41125 [Myxococcota bacterium]
MLWLLLNSAWATCPSPATFQSLSQSLVQAEQAFRRSDRGALEAAEAEAERQLPCLDGPLRPSDVASFMRLKGIALFVRKERDAATVWFEAARSVEPSYNLPEALIPERHPLRRAFEAIEVSEPASDRLPEPAEGWLEVNGRPADEVPAELPWILQWRDGSGRIRTTSLGPVDSGRWPYPLRYVRGRWQIVTSGVVQAAMAELGPVRSGLTARALIEAGGRFAVDAGLRTLFTSISAEAASEVRFIPGAHLGGRVWLGQQTVQPFVGALALLTSHAEQAAAPGGVAFGGIRFGRTSFFVDAGVEAGYSRDGFVQLDVGVGFGR